MHAADNSLAFCVHVYNHIFFRVLVKKLKRSERATTYTRRISAPMSIFGTQFSSCGRKKPVGKKDCAPCGKNQPAMSSYECWDEPQLLDGSCQLRTCPDDDLLCCQTAAPISTATAIVDGRRTLRPWATEDCDPCCPKPVLCADPRECDYAKSRVIESRKTHCDSAIVKLLVNGGPAQKLVLFLELPQCDFANSEVAFHARNITVGDGKCRRTCDVPCEFVVFNVLERTPSGIKLQICFIESEAPAALLETEGPCECYVPFCIEFETWRRECTECCLDVETIVAPPLPPGASVECECTEP